MYAKAARIGVVLIAVLLAALWADAPFAGLAAAFGCAARWRPAYISRGSAALPGSIAFGALIFGAFQVWEVAASFMAGSLAELVFPIARARLAKAQWRRLFRVVSTLSLIAMWVVAESVVTRTATEVGVGIEGPSVLAGAVVATLWLLLDGLLVTGWHSDTRQFRRLPGWTLPRGLPQGAVILSASATFAGLWSYSPGWATALSAAPLVVSHILFLSTLKSERIEAETIRALGRLPEAAGLVDAGHTAAVESLVLRMGVIHGLSRGELGRLRRAAVLHDIGLLYIAGRHSAEAGYSRADKGRWGEEILSRSHATAREASIVGSTGDVYRVPGSDPAPQDQPYGQILQVACSFCELKSSGTTTDEALEALYADSAFLLAPWAVSCVRPALAALASHQGPVHV